MNTERDRDGALPLHCAVVDGPELGAADSAVPGAAGQGPWVLLVHGLFGSGDNLGALGRALAASHRVALVDLRNHGRSPHSAAMDLPLLAADIAALQDRLGTGPCALVGHSLGGKAIMQLALSEPARVLRLVVADIAPVAYPPHHQGIFRALQAVDLRALQSRRDADAQMAPFVPEPAVRQFLQKSLAKGDDGFHWRFNLPALIERYPALCAAPVGNPYPGPALFIRGGASDYIGPAGQAALPALFPRCRLETIEGAGHWLHGEQPQRFNALVEAFLR